MKKLLIDKGNKINIAYTGIRTYDSYLVTENHALDYIYAPFNIWNNEKYIRPTILNSKISWILYGVVVQVMIFSAEYPHEV